MAIGNLLAIDNLTTMEPTEEEHPQQDQEQPDEQSEPTPPAAQTQQVQQIRKLTPGEMVAEIHQKFGYEFKDPILLQQAFTHESCVDKSGYGNYERLEYYGDAALTFLTAREHYWGHQDMAPGKMTLLRAANVDREKLALAAINHKLYELIRHNMDTQGDLAEKVNKFKEELKDVEKNYPEYTLHLSGLTNPPKQLSDIVESLIGAIYVESMDLDITWEAVKKVVEPMITPETIQTHPVTKFIEYCQKHNIDKEVKLDEKKWKAAGKVIYTWNQTIIGEAEYPKKTTAKNRAAYHAYKTILKQFEPDTHPQKDG